MQTVGLDISLGLGQMAVSCGGQGHLRPGNLLLSSLDVPAVGGIAGPCKEILAYELTNLVHGEEEAKKAQESARALFAGGNAAEMPTAELTDDDFTDGVIDILSVVQKSGLCTSRSEARRNVEQGGVSVDGETVKDIKTTYTKERFCGEGIVVKRGKKNFRRVVIK